MDKIQFEIKNKSEANLLYNYYKNSLLNKDDVEYFLIDFDINLLYDFYKPNKFSIFVYKYDKKVKIFHGEVDKNHKILNITNFIRAEKLKRLCEM